MDLITRFEEILEDSKKLSENIEAQSFDISEEINCGRNDGAVPQGEKTANILALGDNAAFMKYLTDEKNMAGKLNLIYIDPPFFSKATYDAVIRLKSSSGCKNEHFKYFAYDDVWQRDMAEYLKMICCRLILMKKLLSEEGTIWVHLDWHIVHYVKVFMDEIFGEENFVNEIIWQYKSGGSGKRHFSRKHDTILVYSKSKKYYFSPDKEKSYNRGFKPYRFKGVKEYKDELGWYTMVTMKDVWSVDMVGRTSSERTGYATQKPEALLNRIISGATKEGDICADFFCGSGTLAAAAEKAGRRWICCDDSSLAVAASLKRLQKLNSSIKVLENKFSSSESAAPTYFRVEREKTPVSDKELLRIFVEGYELKEIPGGVDEKGRILLERVRNEDPVQLIEYWSVDFDYDGVSFRPDVIFSKEKGEIETCCEKLVNPSEERNIRVKIVDILGNYTMYDIK